MTTSSWQRELAEGFWTGSCPYCDTPSNGTDRHPDSCAWIPNLTAEEAFADWAEINPSTPDAEAAE